MTWSWSYSVLVRDPSCKGPDGKLLGQKCPQLWRKGGAWNSRHGSAGFAGRTLSSDGVRLFRRFGYASKAEADDAGKHVGKLFDAAETHADRVRIGDMLWSLGRDAPLPSVEHVRRRLGLGMDLGEPGLTVGDWLDTWLAAKRRTKRESTCRGYEMHIRTWLKPQFGHLPLERLNAGHIEELFATIARVNAEVTRQRAAGVAPMEVQIDGDFRGQSRQCGPTTQLRIFATLRAALNAAVRQRRISWNPCVGVELEHPDTAERQRWTPAEAARFIDATAGDEMGLMFRVGVLRGPRRAELCGFRWADSVLEKPYRDPETGEERMGAVLGVERPIIQLGGKLRESKAKTKMGQRPVFLDHETAELLREHRKAQLKLRLKAGEGWQDDDLIFCQADGRPWNPDHVSKRFKKLASGSDVPVITLHEGGRHTGNSLMQDAGVDQELRMREIGHAGRAVNDRYTHPLEQAHLAASERTAALVRKARKAS
jgi:integrase